MTFPELIFTKLLNVEQYYVQISYTEFHPNRKINIESKDINSFVALSEPLVSLTQFSLNSKLPHQFLCRILSILDKKKGIK